MTTDSVIVSLKIWALLRHSILDSKESIFGNYFTERKKKSAHAGEVAPRRTPADVACTSRDSLQVRSGGRMDERP